MLKHGDRAIITYVEADQPRLAAKYAARGIVAGTSIDVVRAGDPLLLSVDQDRWAINLADAAHIHVHLITRRRSILSLLFSS